MTRRARVFAGLLAAVGLAVSGCGRDEPADPTPDAPPPVGSASPATVPSEDNAAEGLQFATQIVDALNAGDPSSIKDHACKEKRGVGEQELRELPPAGQRVRLKLDPAETVSQSDFLGADLTGTVGGKHIYAGRISAFREDSGWCLYTFYVL